MASIGIDKLITDHLFAKPRFCRDCGGAVLAVKRHQALPHRYPPQCDSLLFTLGTLAIIGADLQTSNVVSFTVAVGLAVDDTIHFIVRFYERKSNQSYQDAITNTFLGMGMPSSHQFVLVMGFGALACSPLTTTAHFGLLSAVTLGAAILADLLLLPALLHLAAPNDTPAVASWGLGARLEYPTHTNPHNCHCPQIITAWPMRRATSQPATDDTGIVEGNINRHRHRCCPVLFLADRHSCSRKIRLATAGKIGLIRGPSPFWS